MGDYEHYEFHLANKTLSKMTLHGDHLATGGQEIASVVITDAADLKEAAKACMVDRSGNSIQLAEPHYDPNRMTLTIRAEKDEGINAAQLQGIHITDPTDPYDLCNLHSAGWHVNETGYKLEMLNGSQASVPLVSDKYPGVTLTLDLAMGDTAQGTDVPQPKMINI